MANDRKRGSRRRKGSQSGVTTPAVNETANAETQQPAEPVEQAAPAQEPRPAAAAKDGAGKGARSQRERPQAPPRATPKSSPLGFWRRSRTRSARQQDNRKPAAGAGGLFSNFYFPPWAPVVGVMIIVFGILAGVFFFRQTTGDPKVGDHWHASYEVVICGERQPDIPAFEGPEGVHSHGDGLVHMHPFNTSGEGAGARLVRFFEYGGGELTGSRLRMPGEDQTYRNGETCPNSDIPAEVQVFVNDGTVERKLDDFTRYVPQDGDTIRIVYGPPEEPKTENPGLQIPLEQATREIDIIAGDRSQAEADGFFAPTTFTIAAGETVKVNVRNTGQQAHNLRVAGGDAAYNTADDFITTPLLLEPGESGYAVVRLSQPGQYVFRCDVHPQVQTGVISVIGQTSPTPTEGTATPAP